MSYKFSIMMRDSSTETNHICKEIEAAGGTFQGDSDKGTIAIKTLFGKVAGTYSIRGCLVRVEITDKPLLVPLSMIESKIKAYLA